MGSGSSPRRNDEPLRGAYEQLRSAVLNLAAGEFVGPDDSMDPEATRAVRSIAEQLQIVQHQWTARETELWRRIGSGTKTGLYVALCRIDRFDTLAKRIGSDHAEAVLLALQARVAEIAPSGQIGRVSRGVIELAFCSPSATQAESLLSRLHGRLEQRLECQGDIFHLNVAIGATAADQATHLAEVIERAERALALADAGGLPCVMWNEQHHADASARLALTRDLRVAIADEALGVVYQPKLNLRTGRIDSAEALVRWRHPTSGFVPPDQFVALAEDTGDIEDLTKFVLLRTIADQARLIDGGCPLSMNVNLSGRLVADESFCDWAMDACNRAAGAIGLEITETAVFTDPEHALRNLRRMAEGGVSISIDDYGSGLSSLAYLKQLPARELKIDRLFVSGLTSSHRDPLIVRSTIDLAHALEMEVTAEGVDDQISVSLLKAMGCDRVQGFHIAPPLDLQTLESFVAGWTQREPPSAAASMLRSRAG